MAVKKTGYEDYEAKVVILEGKRVHFYAPLTLLSPTPSTPVTTQNFCHSGKNPYGNSNDHNDGGLYDD